jgi:WD40 repeat protein
MGRLQSDYLVAEAMPGSDWCPAFSMEIVKIRSAPSGRDSNEVNSVAFSHDSKLLASASYGNTIKVWDAATGSLQQIVAVNSNITSLLFDITDSILVTNISRIKVNRTKLPTSSESSQEANSKCDWQGLGLSVGLQGSDYAPCFASYQYLLPSE